MSDAKTLLPPNQQPFERANARVDQDRLAVIPVNAIRDARVGATAPKQLLPFLGWERSVHHPSDDEATMRARVDASFADHLSYGSPAALESEIALDVGLTVAVAEFFEVPGLAWPGFAIDVVFDMSGPTPDVAPALRSALLRKNVRDWPDRARLKPIMPVAPFNVGASVFAGMNVQILPENFPPPPPSLVAGAAIRVVSHIGILP